MTWATKRSDIKQGCSTKEGAIGLCDWGGQARPSGRMAYFSVLL